MNVRIGHRGSLKFGKKGEHDQREECNGREMHTYIYIYTQTYTMLGLCSLFSSGSIPITFFCHLNK